MKEELNIINPEDKSYYDKFYKISMYLGVGVETVSFGVYANDENQALEIAVADAELNRPGNLYSLNEIEDYVFTNFDEEYQTWLQDKSGEDYSYTDSWFDFAQEYLGYIYIDGTEYGASQPYFIEGNNLRIEEANDEPIFFENKEIKTETMYPDDKMFELADKIIDEYGADRVCKILGMNYETEFGEIGRLKKWLATMDSKELKDYFPEFVNELDENKKTEDCTQVSSVDGGKIDTFGDTRKKEPEVFYVENKDIKNLSDEDKLKYYYGTVRNAIPYSIYKIDNKFYDGNGMEIDKEEVDKLILFEENKETKTEATFKDKVKAIKKNLKKNDKRLSDETAQKSAEKIAGSMVRDEKKKKEENVNHPYNLYQALTVEPGYHEWLVKEDNDLIYTFNIGALDDEEKWTEKVITDFVVEIVEDIAEKYPDYTEEDLDIIEQKIKEALVLHYGLDESKSKKQEYYQMPEDEHIIWDTEIDYYDKEYMEDVKNLQYQDYLNELGEDEEPEDFETWYDNFVNDNLYDMEWEYLEDDLENNIFPSIDKQLNNNILLLSGNYGSNYADFRPSGAGGVMFENGTEEFRNYMSGFDRVCITTQDGILGAICADHDGTVSGQFFTLPDDKTELIKAMGYEEEGRKIFDEYDDYGNFHIADYENVEEFLKDYMPHQFDEDIYYGGIDASDLNKHIDLLKPIKDTISGYTPDPKGTKTESKEIKIEAYNKDELKDLLDNGETIKVGQTQFKVVDNQVCYYDPSLTFGWEKEHPTMKTIDDLVNHLDNLQNNNYNIEIVSKDKKEKSSEEIYDLAKNTNVQDWYINKFPDDELGNEINSDITFYDIFEALDHYKDIYELLGVDDSVIRERVFDGLDDILDEPNGYSYEQWLLSDTTENKEIKQESEKKEIQELEQEIKEDENKLKNKNLKGQEKTEIEKDIDDNELKLNKLKDKETLTEVENKEEDYIRTNLSSTNGSWNPQKLNVSLNTLRDTLAEIDNLYDAIDNLNYADGLSERFDDALTEFCDGPLYDEYEHIKNAIEETEKAEIDKTKNQPRKRKSKVKTEDIEYISQKELDELPDDYKTTVGDTIKNSWEDKEKLKRTYKDLGFDDDDPMILTRDTNGGTILKPVKVKKEDKEIKIENAALEIAQVHFADDQIDEFKVLDKEAQFERVFNYLDTVEYDFCLEIEDKEKSEMINITIKELESLKAEYPDKIEQIDKSIEKFKALLGKEKKTEDIESKEWLSRDNKDKYSNGNIWVEVDIDPDYIEIDYENEDIDSEWQDKVYKIVKDKANEYDVELIDLNSAPHGYSVILNGTLQNIVDYMYDQKDYSIDKCIEDTDLLVSKEPITERFLGPSDKTIKDSKAKGLYTEEEETEKTEETVNNILKVKMSKAKDYEDNAKLKDYYYVTVNNRDYPLAIAGWNKDDHRLEVNAGNTVTIDNQVYKLDFEENKDTKKESLLSSEEYDEIAKEVAQGNAISGNKLDKFLKDTEDKGIRDIKSKYNLNEQEASDLEEAIAYYGYLSNEGVIFTTIDSLMNCFTDMEENPIEGVTENTKKAFAEYILLNDKLYVSMWDNEAVDRAKEILGESLTEANKPEILRFTNEDIEQYASDVIVCVGNVITKSAKAINIDLTNTGKLIENGKAINYLMPISESESQDKSMDLISICDTIKNCLVRLLDEDIKVTDIKVEPEYIDNKQYISITLICSNKIYMGNVDYIVNESKTNRNFIK